ncbi:S8 family peptidase [Devosia sp. ZW T5_3]|uniref:S8 family peptidase n=1 Tax=Devosia sp. ZW T5_3 TaxID=3378085 RepID=UPI003853EDD4
MSRFKHLHIHRLGVAPAKFEAPRGFGPERITSIQNRYLHAQELSSALNVGTARLVEIEAAQARAKVQANRRGTAITIEAREGFDILAGNSRPTSAVSKLLSVKRGPLQEDGKVGPDVATYFLTKTNLKTFRSQLEDYGNWVDRGQPRQRRDNDGDEDGDKPNNFWLFETAATIRASTIRDYWTDTLDRLPATRDKARWEVWVRVDQQAYFAAAAEIAGVVLDGNPTSFLEVAVQNVIGTPEQIQSLIEASASVVELRSASALSSDFLDMDPPARAAAVDDIAGRLAPPDTDAPRITILDTGFNANHPLLKNSVAPGALYAADASWATGDHDGHGTKMAGVAQFLDLGHPMYDTGKIGQWTRLESVVVQAPTGKPPLPAHDAIERGVALAEQQRARRVFCLAQTARGELTTGRGTATSATIDKLAYNDGKPRLFCVAAGNVPRTPTHPYQVGDYLDRNRRFAIEAPGQAFNVITVGAMTTKTDGPDLVSPSGDMAPTSRSAESWPDPHPFKPDIVMEGGNFSMEGAGYFAHPSRPNLVLTTAKDFSVQPLGLTGETSAATAAASGLLARLMSYYPRLTPQSYRGLLVHSAEWTEAMNRQYQALAAKTKKATAKAIFMGRYGWGVPNQPRLYASADNEMTLVIEDELQPFQNDGSLKLKEMKYFTLPWPIGVLRALGQTQVELKVTLSYFIEPEPHAFARDRYDRYASHRLRFDVRRFNEDHSSAQSRFNAAEDSDPGASDDGWDMGAGQRGRGSLHQDIWRGPAYQLAERDGIAVGPVKGWWAEIGAAKRYDRKVPFSLIVSLKAPAGTDLFTETRIAAEKAKILVEQPVIIEV